MLIDRNGEQQLTVSFFLTCKITALESLEIYKKKSEILLNWQKNCLITYSSVELRMLSKDVVLALG